MLHGSRAENGFALHSSQRTRGVAQLRLMVAGGLVRPPPFYAEASQSKILTTFPGENIEMEIVVLRSSMRASGNFSSPIRW